MRGWRSKGIEDAAADTQLSILRHNVQIYESVFPWLQLHRIPFLFTSSYVVNQVSVLFLLMCCYCCPLLSVQVLLLL